MLTVEDIEDICIDLDSMEHSLTSYDEGHSNALKDVLFLCTLGFTVEEILDKMEAELGMQDVEASVYDVGYSSALETVIKQLEDLESERTKI